MTLCHNGHLEPKIEKHFELGVIYDTSCYNPIP